MKTRRITNSRLPAQPDFLVLGMSSAYQPLSRRLQAMKSRRSFSRRQIALAGFALAAVALVAIIPWQVVAQEAKPDTNSAAKAQGLPSLGLPDKSDKATSPNERAATEELAEMKKRLVGTWKGGYYPNDELTLREDGTFQRSYRKWVTSKENPTFALLSGDQTQQGHWSLGQRQMYALPSKDDKDNTVISLNLEIDRDGGADPLWLPTDREAQPSGGPVAAIEAPHVGARNRWFSVERLDKDFLRLKIYDGEWAITNWDRKNETVTFLTSPMLFYRREAPAADRPKFDSQLPEYVRQLAALVQMTPEEANSFQRISSQTQPDGSPNPTHALAVPENLILLERIDAARHHQQSFAQLFELTAAEVTAFRDLMRQVDGDYHTALLIDNSNLSATEQSALKKLQDVGERFATLQSDLSNDGSQFGIGKHDPSVVKLIDYCKELGDWLDSTVYNVPAATENAKQGSGGF